MSSHTDLLYVYELTKNALNNIKDLEKKMKKKYKRRKKTRKTTRKTTRKKYTGKKRTNKIKYMFIL